MLRYEHSMRPARWITSLLFLLTAAGAAVAEDPAASRQQGRAYFALGQYQDALMAFKAAVGPEGSPHDVDSLYWLGETLLKLREAPAARDTFSRVLQQFPTSPYAPFAQYSIAWSYWEAERWDEALTQFQAVVDRYPDDPLRVESQFRAGECLVRLGRPAEAAAVLTAFVTTSPVTTYAPQAYCLLGEAYLAQQQFDHAVAAYEKAIGGGHGPQDLWAPVAQSGIGFARFAQGAHAASAAAFERYLDHYPRGAQHDQVQFTLGQALAALGRTKDAAEQFTQLTRRRPDSAWADDALLWLGQVRSAQGRGDEAAAHFAQLVHDYPASALRGHALYALGQTQLALGQRPEALNTFQAAADEPGATPAQRASALAEAGDLLMAQQAYDAALAAYDRLLTDYRQTPYAEYAQYQLGRTLAAAGRHDAAMLAFEALLNRYPASRLRPLALATLGRDDDLLPR